ncbi:hypothetical protein Nepgr_019601 [Nepenthes gracilis]|uniref:Uncharacterized protein n=1 Tax=Nepenthes gracilis TaxID=150966 RepID=A0AAD3XVD9_NEPGR|nr:hypothetical protein Nepgr_019601 [Nepenthes gracilis]
MTIIELINIAACNKSKKRYNICTGIKIINHRVRPPHHANPRSSLITSRQMTTKVVSKGQGSRISLGLEKQCVYTQLPQRTWDHPRIKAERTSSPLQKPFLYRMSRAANYANKDHPHLNRLAPKQNPSRDQKRVPGTDGSCLWDKGIVALGWRAPYSGLEGSWDGWILALGQRSRGSGIECSLFRVVEEEVFTKNGSTSSIEGEDHDSRLMVDSQAPLSNAMTLFDDRTSSGAEIKDHDSIVPPSDEAVLKMAPAPVVDLDQTPSSITRLSSKYSLDDSNIGGPIIISPRGSLADVSQDRAQEASKLQWLCSREDCLVTIPVVLFVEAVFCLDFVAMCSPNLQDLKLVPLGWVLGEYNATFLAEKPLLDGSCIQQKWKVAELHAVEASIDRALLMLVPSLLSSEVWSGAILSVSSCWNVLRFCLSRFSAELSARSRMAF